MSFTEDEEILQDFLIEAGEIIELLGEQLVDLESRPQDTELLNAVFRGYHTIKGGAGFLNINALVEICHHAEDVFNILRQGSRLVDAMLMDVILQVHDVVTAMLESVQQGVDPDPADTGLLQQLAQFAQLAETESHCVEDVPVEDTGMKQVTAAVAAEISSHADAPDSPSVSDEINDDEFEALLDQLHGKGVHGGRPEQPVPTTDEVAPPPEDTPAAATDKAAIESEEITDEEFEALLDQLHGDTAPGMVKKEMAEDEADKPAPGQQPAIVPAAVPVSERSKQAATAAPPAKKEATQVHAETSVRVDTRRLDDIMNLVGELVLVRNRLTTLEMSHENEELAMAVDNLDLVTADLQNAVMKTRMQPIKKVFGRFPRVVRDLARSLNKEITLELMGEETDLDKNLVEALADPLVHLVRNAVDHGIEAPEARLRAGKSRNGTVVLSAEQEGDHILLTITDDGAGMDAEKLRMHAIEKGMLDE